METPINNINTNPYKDGELVNQPQTKTQIQLKIQENITEFCKLGEANEILKECISEGEETLFPFQIPIVLEKSHPKIKKPFLSTFYNKKDLEDIKVKAYQQELLEDRKLLSPEQYRRRIRTGVKEEIIHSLQILSVKLKYLKLSDEKKEKWKTPEEYYHYIQKTLFEELTASYAGRELLIAAGRLYYEDPTLSSIEALKSNDIEAHNREGYITIELIRQIIQVRLGESTSEEAKEKAWDKGKKFGMEAHKTHLRSLACTIKEHAPNPRAVSPMMEEIIQETEALLKPLEKISKYPSKPLQEFNII